jgi:hypothetical protein
MQEAVRDRQAGLNTQHALSLFLRLAGYRTHILLPLGPNKLPEATCLWKTRAVRRTSGSTLGGQEHSMLSKECYLPTVSFIQACVPCF